MMNLERETADMTFIELFVDGSCAASVTGELYLSIKLSFGSIASRWMTLPIADSCL